MLDHQVRGAAKEILERALEAQRRILLVLDFDGTLVPIRRRSALVLLTANQRKALAHLNRGVLRLAILSGRSVWDLRARVGLPEIIYGGVFGLEVSGPGINFLHPKARAARGELVVFAGDLRRMFADLPGAWIEEKGVGLSLHHRGVPPRWRAEFERRLGLARKTAPRNLEWRLGKRVWEVSPKAGWDKGRAAELMWERMNRPFLITIGDELSDEPMLALARSRGAGVHVGGGDTGAKYRFRNTTDVFHFLGALAHRIESDPIRYNDATGWPLPARKQSPPPSVMSVPAGGR